ncbi:MAG: hypothetical protein M0C28_21000 [Candidatus Moduliflexus flocculans]|nr:hypothetical protein [Candidatus Moduliflexus flocculans]
MKFKEVFLVVVLILAGFVLFQFKTGQMEPRRHGLELGRRLRLPRRPRIRRTRRPGRSRLPCRRASRSRTATAGSRSAATDQADVQLTFKKVVWRKNEEEAEDIAGRHQVRR